MLATFTVSSLLDTPDANPGDNLCQDASDPPVCTLRAAIEEANAHANSGGADRIEFGVAGTIAPGSALPAIADQVVIDGYTAPGAMSNSNSAGQGFNTVLTIVLDGTSAGMSSAGLQLGGAATAAGSTVRGLVIQRFDGPGIYVATDTVTIEGNFIGTNAAGTATAGNNGSGVFVDGDFNTIGSGSGLGNLISGGNSDGVLINGSTLNDNHIVGNLIGTNAAGTGDLGNAASGVLIIGATNNTIGGATAGARNVISGNDQHGIQIHSNASGNVIQGNYIGTDVGGTMDLGNTFNGIAVSDTGNTQIGGSNVGEGNVVSGNDDLGILLNNTPSATIRGNLIGTDKHGTGNVGNAGNGIFLDVGVNSTTIGGAAAGAGNTIANNGAGAGGAGLVLSSLAGTGNSILSNSFFNNAGIGIDLNQDGVQTANDAADADTGPNQVQNFPIVSLALIDGNGNLNIDYLVDTATTSATYPLTVQFFEADSAVGGEGAVLFSTDSYGSTAAQTVKTVNLGNAAPLGIVAGDVIVATVTDAGGNTSEFSSPVTVTLPPPTIVYVDDDFAGLGNGETIADVIPNNSATEPATFGRDAFAVLQDGLSAVAPGGTVFVNKGMYAGATITESVTLSGTTGTAADVVIDPSTGDGLTLMSGAANVTIEAVRVTGGDDGINSSGVANLTLRNVQVDSNTGSGLGIDGTTSLSLADVVAFGNTMNSVLSGTPSLAWFANNGPDVDQFAVTATQIRYTRGAALQNPIDYSGLSSLFIHTGAGADHVSATPVPGLMMSFDGTDPTTAPGDTIDVDFLGNTGGHTVIGVGTGRYNAFGGAFGQIDYTGFETATDRNVTGLNLHVIPEVDLGAIRVVGEGAFTELFTLENVLVGRFNTSPIETLTYTGSDAFDDHLILDLSGGGSILPPGGTTMSGGEAGNDQLTIIGDDSTPEVLYAPSGMTPGDGDIEIGDRTISFTGLEPVDVEFVGTTTNPSTKLLLPNNDDVLTIQNGKLKLGSDALVVTGKSGGVDIERELVRNATNMVIDTTVNKAGVVRDGNDTITIASADNGHGNKNLTINTGAGANTVTINGKVSVATLTVGGATLTLGGNDLIGDSAKLVLETGTTFDTQSRIDAFSGLTVNPDAIVKGSGTIKAPVTIIGGTVAPGGSGVAGPGGGTGILKTGNVSFTGTSTLAIEINGTTAGTQHDQLDVTGSVTLGGAMLSLTGTFTGAAIGTSLVIVNNDGSDPVSGTFSQGASVALNGELYTISYTGGDGNDVVLQRGGALTFVGTGADDVLTINATNADSGSYQLTTGIGTPNLRVGPVVPFNGITSLLFLAGDGNDTLRINNPAGGVFAPRNGTFFRGQGGLLDRLELLGGSAPSMVLGGMNFGNGGVNYGGTSGLGHMEYEAEFIVQGVATKKLTFNANSGAGVLANYHDLTDDSNANDGKMLLRTSDAQVQFTIPSDLLTVATAQRGTGIDDTLRVLKLDGKFPGGLTLEGDRTDDVEIGVASAIAPMNVGGKVSVEGRKLTIHNPLTTADLSAKVLESFTLGNAGRVATTGTKGAVAIDADRGPVEMIAGSTIQAGTGGVAITSLNGGDVTLTAVTTTGGANIKTRGAIAGLGTGVHLTAAGAVLEATNGDVGPLNLDVGRLEGSALQTFDVTEAGDLIVGDVSFGSSGISAPNVRLFANSFTINESITGSIAGGVISLTTTNLSGPGQNLTVRPSAKIHSNGHITLDINDDVTVEPSTRIGNVTVPAGSIIGMDVLIRTGTSTGQDTNVRLDGTFSSQTLTIHGNAGKDQVILKGVRAPTTIAINGGLGTDSVQFEGTAGSDSLEFTANTATTATGSTLTFDSVELVTALLLDGDDAVTVTNPTVDLDLDGGAGTDTLTVKGNPGQFSLNGQVRLGTFLVKHKNFEKVTSETLLGSSIAGLVGKTGIRASDLGLEVLAATAQDPLVGRPVLYNFTTRGLTISLDGEGGEPPLLEFEGTDGNDLFHIGGSQVRIGDDMTLTLEGATPDFNVRGGPGDDTLEIDVSGGFIGKPIVFDGGGGFDGFEIKGTPPTPIDKEIYEVGPEVHRARMRLEDPDNNVLMSVEGINIEPVKSSVAANSLLVVANPQADEINFSEADKPSAGLITISDFESLEFENKTHVQIVAGAGTDTIGISTFSAGFSGKLEVFGGDPGDSDRLVITGTLGNDDYIYRPLHIGALVHPTAGVFFHKGRELRFFSISAVSIDGHDGEDSLTVNGETIVVEPLGPLAFNVAINNLAPVHVVNVEGATMDPGGSGGDTLVMLGSAFDDEMVVDMTGGARTIDVNGRRFNFENTETLILKTGEGHDAVSLALRDGIAVQVHGGGPADGDVLTMKQHNTTKEIRFDDSSIRLGTGEIIHHTGLSRVVMDARGEDSSINVIGTAADDVLHWTPSKLAALYDPTLTVVGALIQRGSEAPAFEVAQFSAAFIQPGGGADHVVFHGSADDDRFLIQRSPSGTATEVFAVHQNAIPVSVTSDQLESLSVLGQAGDDLLLVNHTNGLVSHPGGVNFHGGDGLDSLTFTAPTSPSAVADAVYRLTGTGSGTVVHTLPSAPSSQQVNFTGLEPIADLVAGTLTIETDQNPAVSAANAITVSAAQDLGRIEVDASEVITFANKTDVTIHAGSGPDSIGVSNFSIGYSGKLTVHGGQPGDDDKLIVSGTAGNDTFTYQPAIAPHAGVFTLAGRVLGFAGIEDIVLNGLEGTDSITAFGPVGHPDEDPPAPTQNVTSADFWKIPLDGTLRRPFLLSMVIPADSPFDGTVPFGDTSLGLQDAEGVAVDFDDDSGPGNHPLLFSQIPPNNSQAFLVVDASGNSTYEDYLLFATIADADQALVEAAPDGNDTVAGAERLNGRLAEGTAPPADVDHYLFEADDNDLVAVVVDGDPEVDGSITRMLVQIVDANGKVIAAAENSAPTVVPKTSTAPVRLSAGTYAIRITNAGTPEDAISYRLGVIRTPGDVPPGANPPTKETEPNNDPATAGGFQFTRPGKGIATKPGPDDRVLLEPLGNNESRMRFNESTALHLHDIESVTIDPQGGRDTITVNTSDLADMVAVSRGGVIVNGETFGFVNHEEIQLNTRLGDDLVQATTGVTVPIRIDAGEQSTSDLVHYTASGLAPIVELGFSLLSLTVREQIGSASLAPVTVVAAETLAVNGSTLVTQLISQASLTVLGTDGDDRFAFAPYGPDDVTFHREGLGVTVFGNSLGELVINPRGGSDEVAVTGNVGGNAIAVTRGPLTSVAVDALQPLQIVSAETERVRIDGNAGNDVITIAGSGGAALTIDGGAPGASDVLVVRQEPPVPTGPLPLPGTVLEPGFSVKPGSTPDSGRVGLGSDFIDFAGIEHLALDANGNVSGLTVAATDADNAVTVESFARAGSGRDARVTVDDFFDVLFSGFAAGSLLNVNALNGDDTIRVAPTGLTNLTINIDAGGPAASDHLVVEGADTDDTVAYAPGGDDLSGIITVNSVVTNFSATESVSLVGLGGTDSLTVNATTGEDSIQLQPLGLAGGRFRVNAFSAVDFAAIENVTINGGGADDLVSATGTAINDTASLNKTLLSINRQNFDLVDVELVSVDLAGGDDAITLFADSSADSTTTVLLLDGGPIIGRGGFPQTTLGGVEQITLDADGGNVQVATTDGDDQLSYRPTAAQSGVFRRDGLATELRFHGAALLEVDLLAGHDTLIVEGNQLDNGFQLRQVPLQTELQISDSRSRTSLQGIRFRTDSTESLRIFGREGSDTFNVTPLPTTTIFIDGGDPIGAGDSLKVLTAQATLQKGPENDEGVYLTPGAMPVSFDHIEDSVLLSLAVPQGHVLANVQSVPNPSPRDTPFGATFPLGFLRVDVQVPTAGDATIVTITIPPGVTAPTTYYKYGTLPGTIIPQWYVFRYDAAACAAATNPLSDACTGAEFQDIDGDGKTDRILLHLIDGRRGDGDLAANRTIVDPGGPSFEQAGPGDVRVELIGGRLVVTGDKGDNHVRIVPGTTGRQSLRVIGQDGTTVNGEARAVEFTKVKRGVAVDLGDGDDDLVLNTKPSVLRGSMDLDTGNGNDRLRLESVAVRGPLNIETGTGDDLVEMVDMVLSQPIEVLLGDGDDVVTIERSRFRGPINVVGGDGRDALTIIESLLAGPLLNDLGDGDAQTELVNTVTDRRAGRGSPADA
jgi:CSLREA domain-containing protein